MGERVWIAFIFQEVMNNSQRQMEIRFVKIEHVFFKCHLNRFIVSMRPPVKFKPKYILWNCYFLTFSFNNTRRSTVAMHFLNVFFRENSCHYLCLPVLGGSIFIRKTRKVYERRDFTLYSRGCTGAKSFRWLKESTWPNTDQSVSGHKERHTTVC